MLPVLIREIVQKRNDLQEKELLELFALSQCAPGIIAVNVAILIGREKNGKAGGVFAAMGVVVPSLVISTLIAAFFLIFWENEYVRHAFAGVRVGVCALILSAVIRLWKNAVVDITTFAIFAIVLGLAVFTPLSPMYFIILAILCGIIIGFLRKKAGGS